MTHFPFTFQYLITIWDFLHFLFFFLAIQSASVRGGSGGRGATPPSQASGGTSMNSLSGMHGGGSSNSAHLAVSRTSTSAHGVQD